MQTRKPAVTMRVMKLAKHPCTALVNGRPCRDIWREVLFCRRKRVSTRCYTHGHVQDRQGNVLGTPSLFAVKSKRRQAAR